MKYDILGFPKEYIVDKEIKEQFLKSSTLSEKRRELIEERVREIELYYDLRFFDNTEIVVLFVEIDKEVDNWTESNVANAIASSFPHESMIVVHNGTWAYIYCFDAEMQVKNNGRMRINKVYKSPGFNMKKLNEYEVILDLIKMLRADILFEETAKATCIRWRESVDKAWEKYKYLKQLKNNYFIKGPDGSLRENWQKIYEDEEKEYEWNHSIEKFLNDKDDMRDKEYSSLEWRWFEE